MAWFKKKQKTNPEFDEQSGFTEVDREKSITVRRINKYMKQLDNQLELQMKLQELRTIKAELTAGMTAPVQAAQSTEDVMFDRMLKLAEMGSKKKAVEQAADAGKFKGFEMGDFDDDDGLISDAEVEKIIKNTPITMLDQARSMEHDKVVQIIITRFDFNEEDASKIVKRIQNKDNSVVSGEMVETNVSPA